MEGVGMREWPLLGEEIHGRKIVSVRAAMDGRKRPEWNGWKLMAGGRSADDGATWKRGRLAVIESLAIERDDRCWHHVSLSRNDGSIPSWDQLRLVKDDFVGTEQEAYVVLPPHNRYVEVKSAVKLK